MVGTWRPGSMEPTGLSGGHHDLGMFGSSHPGVWSGLVEAMALAFRAASGRWSKRVV